MQTNIEITDKAIFQDTSDTIKLLYKKSMKLIKTKIIFQTAFEIALKELN